MPGLSIGKFQAAYLQTLHLDQIGESKGKVEAFKLDEVEEALLAMAAIFKVSAENNLTDSNTHSSGALSKSIQFDKVKYFGGEYSIEISALDYYKFINSGVNGLVTDHGSPYSFKNMGVSKSMLKSVKQWVIREGLKVRVKSALADPTKQERKGRPFSGQKGDEAEQTAFVISKGIKKNGIRPTKFWDKALSTTQKEMKKGFGSVFVPIIVNELKK